MSPELNKTNKKRRYFKIDYLKDTSGNFAMIMAVIAAVLLAGTGLAVDGTKAYSAKSKLQDTTDAIALMAAKDSKKSEQELNQAAKEYLMMKYGEDMMERMKINYVKREGDSVSVAAQHNIDTFFGGILGKKTLDVSTLSTAIYSEQAVNLSLVLDTTFSMNGTKMNNLKNASNALIKTIEDLDNDNIRMSVVPFAQYVNVGVSRRHSNWLDVPADYTETGPETCQMKRDVTSQTNCREVDQTCENDGVSYPCQMNVCDYTFGPEYEVCGETERSYTWRGCVGSRLNPNHLQVAYRGYEIPGLMNVSCGTVVQPLTNDLSKVRDTVNNMDARGETYMPSGLMWGWRMLDDNLPFNESENSSPGVTKTNKILVLMTDGENTKSKQDELHVGSDARDANQTTASLCKSIKGSDIIVYTIAYAVKDNDTKSLLETCASDKGKFFKAKDAKTLVEAFEEVGRSLSALRVSA